MILFYQPRIPQGVRHLDAEESRHCVKVLRKRAGDTITVTDGQGVFYDVRITDAQKEQCGFDIVSERKEPRRNFHIHLAIAPTKNPDRVEWFTEKAVEMGVDRISFIYCHNSERTHFKTSRIERIVASAMKQSLKATLPEIVPPRPLAELVAAEQATEKFIAYVDTDNPDHLMHLATKGTSYCVLIGPEGDFSPDELALAVAHGYRKVSLGTSRLRTETAGMAACHILNLVNLA